MHQVPVESSKGEWGRGQHEINFTCGAPLPMADRHALFKQGVREIAEQHGKAATFMAKVAPGEAGSSCHIHMSLWKGGRNLFAAENVQLGRNPKLEIRNPKPEMGSRLFRQFLGGLMKYSPELSLFFGPTINSYKRYQPGSWAPTRMAWAVDNRTTGFRVVGEGKTFRIGHMGQYDLSDIYAILGALEECVAVLGHPAGGAIEAARAAWESA